MYSASRRRLVSIALLTCVSMFGWAAVAGGNAFAHSSSSARHARSASGGPSVKRFSLAGYVLDAQYSLGRNAGNTFEQTYKSSAVHGVPIKGPFVGSTFPVEDYVAMPIGNHELYVAWLDTKTHALLDVFVMDFKTHVVFDYAPGSLHPESSGTVKIVKTGKTRLP
jgi:hypothetical protein